MSGDDNTTIEIKSKSGFRGILDQLGQTHQQLPDGNLKTEEIRQAAAAAAHNGQSGAPAFVPALTALDTSLGGLQAHINAASSSVTAAITELTAIVDGLSDIDERGAASVKEA